MESDGEKFSSGNGMYMNKDYPRSLDKKKILKPIRQEKIVKVPVTEYVEKIVEQEEIKYVNKYVDVIKPIITYKTKHVPKPIYLDKIRYETKVIEKEKIIHIPKIQYKNKIVEVPVYVHREKIIEKKVPLIIERVVPVLKVKKTQKDVYLDSIEIPDICEIKTSEKKEKVNRNFPVPQRENSIRKQSVQRNGSVASYVKVNEDDTANMKTYRLEEEVAPEMTSNKHSEIVQNYKYKGENMSESSHANSEVDSKQEQPIVHKHETKYHEDVLRETNNDSYSENSQRIIYTNEKREEPNYLGNGNSFLVKTNEQYNTLGVSIHLPEYEPEGVEYSEQKSTNEEEQNYHLSVNNIQGNDTYDNGKMYLGNHLNNQYKSVSEQVFRNENSRMDPKLHYSFPAGEAYQESYQNNKEQIEMEKAYSQANGSVQITHENNTMQNIQMNDYNKQNLRPSYANSNGQAMISVRPATIVEFKPKSRKMKNPMCNFLNNCCGGQQN